MKMNSRSQVEVFRPNMICWKIMGIWPAKNPSKLSKFHSFCYINTVWIMNLLFFILSFIYIPAQVQLILDQLLYFFVFLGALTKLRMIVLKRDKILELFNLLETEEFLGEDEEEETIIKSNKEYYWKFWKATLIFYCVGITLTFLTLYEYLIFKDGHLASPLCEYYFINTNTREKYFTFIYTYQGACLLCIVFFCANLNSFICGLILMAITQFKMLNWKVVNLALVASERTMNCQELKDILESRLNKCLKHYDMVLRYCDILQEVLSLTIFAQYSTGAVTMCCSVSPFLNTTEKNWVTVLTYSFTMIIEMLYPAMLGTRLTEESENLVFSAYCSDWIPRPINFKRSLRLLIERASRPVVLTGLQMVELSMITFASTIKTAYSLFTLTKKVVQE